MANTHQRRRSSSAALAALLCALLCVSKADSSNYKLVDPQLKSALDTGAKVLWLPAQSNDCVATCRSFGLESVTGYMPTAGDTSNSALCSSIMDDIWWEGVKRSTPNACQIAYRSKSGLSVASVLEGFYCGCLPRRAGAEVSDSFWTANSTAACPFEYGRVPYVCRVKVGNLFAMGWASSQDPPKCVYYWQEAGANARAKQTQVYQRLCTTTGFSYLTERGGSC